MKIEKIGVVGAGQMGNGIAHVCALAGYDVVMEDVNPEALGKAKATIERNLQRQAARGLIRPEEVETALKRIRAANDLEVMRDRDLVIEVATEDEQVKRAVYRELCPRLGPKTMLASNTSSISITRLAAASDPPEKFI